MKFHSIFLLILSFIVLSCNGQTSKNVKTIEAEAFAEKIAATPNPQILDVRTPEEFASDHIDNAKNVNWLSNDFVTNAEKFDKSKPVFVYCKSGGRSQKAAEKLNELGFTTIYQLEGGILKWDAAELSKPSDKIIGLSVQKYNKLLNSDKKVLINFYAEWCAPCKKMTPYILQMQKELADKVTIIRLNADENKTLLSEMKISELPTLLLYENKEVKWKHSGFISENDLRKQLQ
ncbi:thioredoxin domain-containing protein [Flavobacterium gawalongense]|uniref:Redoxin domain-containing protein n=1 Tax=Flavobacterium gawalongense TaxID=2594432 RepID=A0A553BZI8_9FLAO|nr:thioredoxin domain-containing protein [Flavobacterium gawalongense]TRX04633.1 redoxin domain-containing protein [Flavobacterium gawalongense]TRX10520.1 redoxin domain-containing protein [Flavobacterium gawalongense]TRX13563.1 redoxin domain-containing protein [Flavobacterium gawalongense]TRX15505.1 redoxin domain-containing protein [Flavobacterium gawalongense]TRX31344.1 redoxin domain-containing protein [Flavobacterium gawalongense]